MSTTQTDTIVPDGWELLPGGRAALWIDGTAYRLKAPKLGELKDITQLIRETTDTNAEVARKVQSEIDEMKAAAEAGAGISEADQRDRQRDLIRSMNEQFQEAWWDLLRHVCAVLQCRIPDDDDLPAWVITDGNNELSALISHFQTAPPPRGGRGK